MKLTDMTRDELIATLTGQYEHAAAIGLIRASARIHNPAERCRVIDAILDALTTITESRSDEDA